MNNSDYLAKAKSLDGIDKLQSYWNQFDVADKKVIYLDGNSLGRLPKATEVHLQQVIKEQWGNDLIDSWNKNWYHQSEKIGNKIASLIGAEPGEVIVSDNTSINLYKLASAALNYQKSRNTIVTDEFNFPSDVYILQGLLHETGNQWNLDYIKSKDGISINDQDIRSCINDKTALVSLSHVAFKSAFLYDMKKVTSLAHQAGSLVLWDLSHSVGAVPINLNDCNVDLAVGCTYKYLNGGPGAPAFLYVRKDLQDKLLSPIWGWFGADDPFNFNLDYSRGKGVKQYLTGTPTILSQAAIEPGLDLIIEVGINEIRKKSIKMSDFFIEMWGSQLKPLGFELASPSNADIRGSHISISHKEGYRITKALMDSSLDGTKVIPDFRTPDNIRFGFAPMYNSYEEVYQAVNKLKLIIQEGWFEKYDHVRGAIT